VYDIARGRTARRIPQPLRRRPPGAHRARLGGRATDVLAPPATPTATGAGRCLRCGVHAMTGTWSGAAGAATPFTHRSRDRIAESATEAPSRCGKTNMSAHRMAKS
jgi:hypothetical protein